MLRRLIIILLFPACSLTGGTVEQLIPAGVKLPIKSLTPYILQATREGKYVQRERPELPCFYDTPNFRVWYTTEGDSAVSSADTNSNSVPDWVETAGELLEHSLSVYIDSLGYNRPLPDSSSFPDASDVGGDDRIDFYILDIDNTAYGWTVDERYPVGQIRLRSGYSVIDNDYANIPGYADHTLDALAVTCAHELFHLVQFTYDAMEDIWWMEATAVFMEDYIFDAVNDYINYLPIFFDNPDEILTSSTLLYGSAIFPRFLWEFTGDINIIHNVWENCSEPFVSSIGAIESACEHREIDFNQIFANFTLWNLFTGRNCTYGKFYREAELYPEISTNDINEYEFQDSGLFSPSSGLYKLSCSYLWFYQRRDRKNISLEIDCPSGMGANIVLLANPGTDANNFYQTISSFPGTVSVDSLYRYEKLVVIPFVSSNTSSVYDYELRWEYSGETALPKDEPVFWSPYPNPSTDGMVYFPCYVPNDGKISLAVFTASGEFVTDEEQLIYTGFHRGKNSAMSFDGRNLAEGIYTAILKFADKRYKAKFAIVGKQ